MECITDSINKRQFITAKEEIIFHEAVLAFSGLTHDGYNCSIG